MADKALLCGINDYKSIGDLRGCLNDVDDMRRLLAETFGFKEFRVLKDQDVTKAKVKQGMKWLFQDARKGDRVVFHFSGHGSFTADANDDEDSGADELICLYDMDFDKPGTYLFDDELCEWTKQLPPDVQLLIVMDNCHSGTGTRLVMAPVPGKPHRERAVRVDDQATFARAFGVAGEGGTRSRSMTPETASAVADPLSDEAVRVRFVDPPPEVKERVAESRARRPGWRGMVTVDINHILLAGCRDDQTSADAFIGGRPCGAFTHHLCKALRAGGPSMDRRDLINRVERALREDRFSQVPQLEAASGSGPLFAIKGKDTPGPTDTGPSNPPGGGGGGASNTSTVLDLLKQLIGGGGAGLSPDERRAILELLKTLTGPRDAGGLDVPGARTAGTRFLIPVHGICRHVEGYSDGWWASLQPHTTAFGEGRRGDTRREVIWSDLVNARAVRAASDQEEVERTVLAARIRGALEERAVTAALDEAPVIASPEMARSLSGEAATRDVFDMDRSAERGAGIFSCVDDFTTYFLNDGVRASVVARFTDVVRPLLAAGAELDIISHSFGTVVAYEGLRELADAGFTRPQVRNFFTVGAALAIGPARGRLRPANRDGRKPAMVKRWVNLDAKGDPVGGRIQHRPFQVDAEYVELPNLGCGLLEFSCAHSSYFKPDNVRVNRDIFAAFINLP